MAATTPPEIANPGISAIIDGGYNSTEILTF
jgi:hypothetical protein